MPLLAQTKHYLNQSDAVLKFMRVSHCLNKPLLKPMIMQFSKQFSKHPFVATSHCLKQLWYISPKHTHVCVSLLKKAITWGKTDTVLVTIYASPCLQKPLHEAMMTQFPRTYRCLLSHWVNYGIGQTWWIFGAQVLKEILAMGARGNRRQIRLKYSCLQRSTGLDTNGCPLGNSKFILLSDNLNICLWLSACQGEKIYQINNPWWTIY